MSSGKSDLVDIEIAKQHETEKAYLFENMKGEKVWLPKSQCEYDGETLTCAEWLAIERGLI